MIDKDSFEQAAELYIEGFADIAAVESAKWDAVGVFQRRFDPGAQDFAGRLNETFQGAARAAGAVSGLSGFARQGDSLLKAARHAPEAVRALFGMLYADDGGDLERRSQAIKRFVAEANALILKASPGNPYLLNEKAALDYLAFRFPERDFLYKAKPCRDFANRVGYEEDWGTGPSFSLRVYYDFCEDVTAHIHAYPPLMDIHETRWQQGHEDAYRDENHHLLAFDLMFSSMLYTEFKHAAPFAKRAAPARKP